ncbi:MAG TPA: glucodextranase DOMON-like domain-containing protein, partial [Rhodothermales bacterium]|nr:glucodextranase DOMON-like domain-containing protein [Rhodothermales bacterium]
IPDNLDAHPHGDADAPVAGGAPVQPWSLAELVRVAWEDLAGVHYRSGAEVVLEPHLPDSWDGLTTRIRLGGGWVGVRMEGGGSLRVTLTPTGDLPAGATVHVRAHGVEAAVPVTVARGDTATAAAPEVTVVVSSDGAEIDGERAEPVARYEPLDGAAWDGFAWATPQSEGSYPVMQAAAAERQLTEAELIRDNVLAIPIITQTDPDGDDWGTTSTYTYPRGFPDHVLDATYLEVAEDDSTTYFRAQFAALAPDSVLGHGETFVAFAISTEEGGQRTVGRNAQYDLPQAGGYEFIVYVGDGLVVEDASGRVLAEVEPGRGSVFDVEGGALAFALPRRVLGQLPSRASVTLLVGARADENGIGEFLRVERAASRRSGGGKVDPSAPNVYDQVSGSVSR